MNELPNLGISAARIESLREDLLAKLEAMVESFDPAGGEELQEQAEAINALAEAFVGLR